MLSHAHVAIIMELYERANTGVKKVTCARARRGTIRPQMVDEASGEIAKSHAPFAHDPIFCQRKAVPAPQVRTEQEQDDAADVVQDHTAGVIVYAMVVAAARTHPCSGLRTARHAFFSGWGLRFFLYFLFFRHRGAMPEKRGKK